MIGVELCLRLICFFASFVRARAEGADAVCYGRRSGFGLHRGRAARAGQRGASLCELGIPYSDPIADGPVIQASYTRALGKKIRLEQILEMARELTPSFKPPLVSMVSYAIVYRHGLEKYRRRCAGGRACAGAIVPDLPVEESTALAKICRAADFSLIQLVTPTTPRPRAVQIAETSTGFLYYVSVTGITGERGELPPDLIDNVAWLRKQTPLPVCIGFGISTAGACAAAGAGGRWIDRRLGRSSANRRGKRKQQNARSGADRRWQLRGRIARRVEFLIESNRVAATRSFSCRTCMSFACAVRGSMSQLLERSSGRTVRERRIAKNFRPPVGSMCRQIGD